MSYLPDNDDRSLDRPPEATIHGQGSITTVWMSEDDARRVGKRKRRPVGFSPTIPVATKKKRGPK